jgi:arylsulfatase A-like enzyme
MRTGSLVTILWLAGAALAQKPLAGSRPNLLFVFSDDHAAHAISAYGSQLNRTPQIDRLAEGGVLFRNTFCGNALCGPSRASILTGLHSHAHGFMRNGNSFDGAQTTMPKLLQAAGYQTALIGKWHLDSTPTGFDHWMVLPDQGQYYNPDFLTAGGKIRLEGHVTDLITAATLQWLEQRDPERPFLLMCQHKAPHRSWLPAPAELGLYRDGDLPEPPTLFDDHAGMAAPIRGQRMTIAHDLSLHYDLCVPPTAAERPHLTALDRDWDHLWARMTKAQQETWAAAYDAENAAFRRLQPKGVDLVRWQYQRYLKNYLRCVAGVDRSVGVLLDWLDRHPDVKANTLVVYMSDQGFFLGDRGFYDKRWMYDESLRMPLLMQWPDRLPAGREVTALAQNIDIAPTFLELAGVTPPATMHGRSLLPLLADAPPADWRTAVYYHFYESHAVHEVAAHFGVRTAQHKLIRYYEPEWDTWELFDLARDPGERRNLAGDPDHAEVLARMQTLLENLRQRYGDDTGELGHDFPLQAGIARVRADDASVQVFANTVGGHLLQRTDHGPSFALTTTLTSLASRPQRNGCVVLAGPGALEFVRAGIDWRTQRLVLVGPGGMREVASAALAARPDDPVQLEVEVDLAHHTIAATALGQRIEAKLPPDWSTISACGYGGNNAETSFTRLRKR